MEINLSKFTDKEIVQVCMKYNIIQADELKKYTRNEVLQEITTWCKYKHTNYKSRSRSNSSPNIKSVTVDKKQSSQNYKPVLQRSKSVPMNMNNMNIKKTNNPPKPNIQNRTRRMSEPLTPKEKELAMNDHKMKEKYTQSQLEVNNKLSDQNMKQYDVLGLYPIVPRVVAMIVDIDPT